MSAFLPSPSSSSSDSPLDTISLFDPPLTEFFVDDYFLDDPPLPATGTGTGTATIASDPQLTDYHRFSSFLFAQQHRTTPAEQPTPAELKLTPPPTEQKTAPPPAEQKSAHIEQKVAPAEQTQVAVAQPERAFENAYGGTKFDILRLLVLLPNRPNPRFSLGVIDLSSAFLVTDPTLPDNPIIYVSQAFEKLTMYPESEIMGQNCRFLQAPPTIGSSLVKKGQPRTHCDNETVAHMAKCLDEEVECQVVILNYTRAGVPFLNLVTMIPIRVPEPERGEGVSHLYIIGLQVDIGSKMFDVIRQGPTTCLASRKRTWAQVDKDDDRVHPRPPFRRIQAIQQPTVGRTGRPAPGDPVHGVCQMTMEGTFLYVSPSAALLLDTSSEKMLGHSFYEYLHPSDIQKVGELHQLVQTTRKPNQRLQTPARLTTGAGQHLHTNIIFDVMVNPVTKSEQLLMYINI